MDIEEASFSDLESSIVGLIVISCINKFYIRPGSIELDFNETNDK